MKINRLHWNIRDGISAKGMAVAVPSIFMNEPLIHGHSLPGDGFSDLSVDHASITLHLIEAESPSDSPKGSGSGIGNRMSIFLDIFWGRQAQTAARK